MYSGADCLLISCGSVDCSGVKASFTAVGAAVPIALLGGTTTVVVSYVITTVVIVTAASWGIEGAAEGRSEGKSTEVGTADDMFMGGRLYDDGEAAIGVLEYPIDEGSAVGGRG